MTRRAAPDLLFQDEIRRAVRAAYRAIPAGAGRAVTGRFYDAAELDDVPDDAVDWALGVGNPVAHAGLRDGEVVLDVGCGAGLDSVLAARRVGPGGTVVGVDMLPEMCDRARAAAASAGVPWCVFGSAEMEVLPLRAGSVDVAISNGVLNLSPRKSRALAELARVLAPGGRLCVTDLTVDRDLPPEVLASEAAWAGCVAGAVSERVLVGKLERAGFTDVELSGRVPFSLDDVAAYPLFTDEVVDLMRRLLPAGSAERVAVGVLVRAVKDPARAPGSGPRAAAPSGRIRLADIPPDAVEAPTVTVRNLKSVDDVHLKVLDVEPGGSTPFHTHTHAHEGVVVSGVGRLRLAGRVAPLAPGDVFSVNPTDPHAIENVGGEPLRFVCMDCFVE